MIHALRSAQLWRLQERFEASAGGRLLLSAGIVVVVLSVALFNLPTDDNVPQGPALRRSLGFVNPVIYGLGLDQYWNVFAPPRQETLSFSAEIFYSDGTRERWTPPTSTGALFGAYRDYRWGKFIENEVQDANRFVLWRPFAGWITRQHTTSRRAPVVVILTRNYYELGPLTRGHIGPGQVAPGRGPWQHVDYLRYKVPQGPGVIPGINVP